MRTARAIERGVEREWWWWVARGERESARALVWSLAVDRVPSAARSWQRGAVI
jgi:hypothetical protein